jgi:arylsulfatase A
MMLTCGCRNEPIPLRRGYGSWNTRQFTLKSGIWGGLQVDEIGDRLTDQPDPRQHGFDYYQSQIEQKPLRSRIGEERTLYRKGGTVLLRNDRVVPKETPSNEKHLTDPNADYAIEMIRSCAAAGQPFFLNPWWLVPHTPYEPAPEPNWSATASEKISEDQHRFRSMVRHMDANTGRILAVLKELNIADDTCVKTSRPVFISY